MRKVLITGIQGSGKSAVAVELNKRGLQTIDSDDISRWEDMHGQPLTQKRPADPSLEWLQTHLWVWNQEKLHECLNQALDRPVVLCGISWNQEQYYSLFDTVILLALDEQTVRQRLLERNNGSIFGKQPNELKFILSKLQSFQNAAKVAGAVVIDAQKPLVSIVDEIISVLE